jgi:hypothetical protein
MEDPEDLTEAKLADFERFFGPLAPMGSDISIGG